MEVRYIDLISRILDNYIGQKQRITPGDDRRNMKSRKLIPLRYIYMFCKFCMLFFDY